MVPKKVTFSLKIQPYAGTQVCDALTRPVKINLPPAALKKVVMKQVKRKFFRKGHQKVKKNVAPVETRSPKSRLHGFGVPEG